MITLDKIINDYNRIYGSSGLRANSAYYRWLVKLLKPAPGSSLLDVSCGEGIFLSQFSKYAKGAVTFGLDISINALVKSAKNASSSRIVNADGQFIPFKGNQFDYVTCLGSLEHYVDPEKGMRELCRVGKENAVFCIVLPNSVSIDFILHVLKNGNVPKEDFQIIEKTASRMEWQDALERNGFKVLKVHASNLWPELFQEGSFKVKSFGKYLRRRLIKSFCPLNLAKEFVFICKKNKEKI